MQKARLIVKDFGPLKDIDIEVRDFLCLIGKQATGKSTIAKLIAIFEDEKFLVIEKLSFFDELRKYGMHEFLTQDTEIYYKKGNFKKQILGFEFVFEFKDSGYKKINFRHDVLRSIIKEYRESNEINEKIKDYFHLLSLIYSFKVDRSLSENFLYNTFLEQINYSEIISDKNFEDFFLILDKEVEQYFNVNFLNDSQYIPSERNFLHIIAENVFGLINNNIQIPKHLLEIGQEYEKALNIVKEIPLNLIDKSFKYKREGKTSYIYHNNYERIDLIQSASGMQSIIPIMLLIEYAKTLKENYHFNYVIEEPELNIYPKTQHQLIKYLIKNVFDFTSIDYQRKKMVITTHSPYILASINNLLLAFQKGKEKMKEVDKIIKKASWINPENFNAYELRNGKSYKIMNHKLGQIKSNMIDRVSDEFSDEFDKILSL